MAKANHVYEGWTNRDRQQSSREVHQTVRYRTEKLAIYSFNEWCKLQRNHLQSRRDCQREWIELVLLSKISFRRTSAARHGRGFEN